jgi:hypothetical protein
MYVFADPPKPNILCSLSYKAHPLLNLNDKPNDLFGKKKQNNLDEAFILAMSKMFSLILFIEK